MTPPVYLFTGPEFGERNDAIENLKNSVSKKFRSVDNYLFYASETPVNEFMSVLQNESLFSEATFITVKNAETIKKKDEIEIKSFCKSGARDICSVCHNNRNDVALKVGRS